MVLEGEMVGFYLGILERGCLFSFFFLFGGRLIRENGNDIGFFVQNRDFLYTV